MALAAARRAETTDAPSARSPLAEPMPGNRGVAGETEGVQLRHDPRADELARQPPEGDPGGFRVVERVHGEHAAAVEVAQDGFVGQGHVAVDVAARAGIVGQTVHGHLGDDQLARVGPGAGQLRRAVEHGGARRLAVDLVEDGHIVFEQCNAVGHVDDFLLALMIV